MSDTIIINVNLTTSPITVNWQTARDAYQIAVDDGFVGTRQEWQESLNGTDGREIELQSADGYIQWRYVGAVSWTNLVALSSITGPAGSDAAVTTANVGTAIAAATAKTTPADADGITIIDSGAGSALKLLSFANLWAWVTTKLAGLSSITVGGAWSFSSTTRPVSSGTGAPANNSLITSADLFAEMMRANSTLLMITPQEFTTSVGNGGFAGAANGNMNLVTSLTASGYARAYVTRDFAGWVGTGTNADCSVPVAFSFSLIHAIPASGNTEYRFVVGEAGTGTPIALGSNPLTGRGFGFRIFWSVANSRREVQLFAHNGASYSESSAIALGATSNGPILSIIVSSDGAGNIKLFLGIPSSPEFAHVRVPNSELIALNGGPTSANYGGPAVVHVVQNGATPPSASLGVRPFRMLIQTGTIY